MALETRLKANLSNNHVWPIGREKLEELVGTRLPNEPSALLFRMPSKYTDNELFLSKNICSIAKLTVDPSMRKHPYVFDKGATALPVTITIFAVPKDCKKQAEGFINSYVAEAIKEDLSKEVRSISQWYGADSSWKELHTNGKIQYKYTGGPCRYCGGLLRTEKSKQCPHCFKRWG